MPAEPAPSPQLRRPAGAGRETAGSAALFHAQRLGVSALSEPASRDAAQAAHAAQRQRRRRAFQLGFFALFLLAPALNLLRLDVTAPQLWVLGSPWSLGLEDFAQGRISAAEVALSIFLRGFLPAIVIIAVFLTVAYRYGRLYCGWLCPHFSVVELLNGLMHRAVGKFSLWDRSATPRKDRQPSKRWWPVFALAALTMAFLWAITLLTYLLPPATVWGNLMSGSLTPNQARFIGIATLVFLAEFTFARHLFCRFGCAAGLFQSLAWMANPRGMVVSFDRDNARDCKSCDAPLGSACDRTCPMRLHPRNIKRMMFSCVQCGRCLSACDESQSAQQRAPLLEWHVGLDAVRETLRQRRDEAAGLRPAPAPGAAPHPAEPESR